MLNMRMKFSILNAHTVSISINTRKKLCSKDGTLKRNERSFRRIVDSLMYLTYINHTLCFMLIC